MLRRAVFAMLLAVLGSHALAQAPTTSASAISASQINVTYSGGWEGFCTRVYRGSTPVYTNCNYSLPSVTFTDGGLAANTTYSYCSQIGVTDEVGNWISGYPCGNTASATTFGPPAAPSSLSATGSGTQINLTWADGSGNESGFLIERKTGSGGTFSQIASVGANVTSYSNTGLSADTSYFYRVRSTNAYGSSGYTNTASANTVPLAPTGLSATVASASQINLAWTDTAATETTFKIERKSGAGGVYAQVATVGAGITTYSDLGLSSGANYFYRVRDSNSSGDSAYSNEANATLNVGPSVSLTSPITGATFTAPASVTLTATATDGDGTIAKVEFFDGATLVGTVLNAPFTITLSNVAAGSHSYTAAATDNLGGSTTSAAASVTVTALPTLTLAFIEVDHLNTPRAVYDASQQLRWKWDQAEPFGAIPPNEDPSSVGAYEFPARFPGQYADKETGASYNGFRDYDAGRGQYVQADPLGVIAGINRYAYALSQPTLQVDVEGLAPTGPWHPSGPNGEDISFGCTKADDCPQISGKIWVIKRMIWSHQFWDWLNPAPRGGGRHAEEIANLWSAYARCEQLWKEKDCDNCQKKTFGDWFRETFMSPSSRSKDAEELMGSDSKKNNSPPFGGPSPFPRPPFFVP